jgi:Trypsin-like peptidase domain
MAKRDIYKLLQECTVRLSSSSGSGTGFFIAPGGWILTCDHVVQQSDNIDVSWRNEEGEEKPEQNFLAKVILRFPIPFDMAILQIYGKVPTHKCVYLDKSFPQTGDNLYTFGYPQGYDSENYSGGDSATTRYEGESFQKDVLILKLKEGQIQEGYSGSPLLNRSNSKVCGVVSISRNTSSDLGGRATPICILFEPKKLTKSLSEQHLILAILERNKNFHRKIDKTWNKIVRQSFWDRKTSLSLAIISLTGFVFLCFDTPNSLITLAVSRFIIACGFGYSSLLFVKSLNLDIVNINRFPISSLTGFLIALLTFLLSFVIIPDKSIVVRNLTGINEYPTFGIIEKSLPIPLRQALDISNTPIIDTNNPIYEAIQAFRDESGNGTLMTKYEKPSGISSAFNQNGRTIRKSIVGRGSGKEEKINQDLSDFEAEPRRFEGEHQEFGYTTVFLPFQKSLEDAEWSSFLPLDPNEKEYEKIGAGNLLQYPRLSDIKRIGDFWKSSPLGIKDTWLEKIVANNPESRGFLAFTYKYFSKLASGSLSWQSFFSTGCGFKSIDRIASTPYVRFIDIQNNSFSSLKIDSIRAKTILKQKYKLTPVFDRNQIFQDISAKDEIFDISIPPTSHLLLPIEFGFDTRNSKNLLEKTDESIDITGLINENLYVSKIPPLGDGKGLRFRYLPFRTASTDVQPSQYLDSINFSKEFIGKNSKPQDLLKLVPNRFAVGALKNIISIRINGKDIQTDNPLNDPRFSMSVYFAYGSCPYLVVYDSRKGYSLDFGTVLTGRQTKSQKAYEIHSLGDNPTKLRIEERDKEITYLDSVSLLYTDNNTGEEKEISTKISKLDDVDEHNYILHQNESLEIDLKKLLPEIASNIRMKINGYYEILPDAIPMNLRTTSEQGDGAAI